MARSMKNLENYCKQQNLGSMSNNSISKSGLAAKGLHLKERGSSKLAKNFIEYVYWTCVIISRIPNEIRQNNATMVKTLGENKESHPKCVSLGYLKINSINKFSDILCLIETIWTFYSNRNETGFVFP